MKRSVWLCSFLALVWANCSKQPSQPDGQSPHGTGGARISICAGHIGQLAKILNAQDIDLQYLYLTLSAPGEDSIVDSVAVSGNGQITVNRTYGNLAGSVLWTLSGRSYDTNDSLIHTGDTTFTVVSGDSVDVTLNLTPAYSMLKAHYFPIRDSVTRVELLVDNDLKDDSSFAKQSRLGDTITLAYDYLRADGRQGFVHTISMNVFGDWNGIDSLLYAGDTAISVYPGQDQTLRMTLYRVGAILPPDTIPGDAVMYVVLGAIATTDIYGEVVDTAAPSTQPGAFTVTTVHGRGEDIHTSGSYAVWRSDNYLMLYDGAGVVQINDGLYSPDAYMLDGQNVAWQCHDGIDNEIFYYDGVSTVKVTDNSLDDRLCDIAGSRIVWYAHDGTDDEIFMYDDSLVQVTDNGVNDRWALLRRDEIVWRQYDTIGGSWNLLATYGSSATADTLQLGLSNSPVKDSATVYFYRFSDTLFAYDGVSVTALAAGYDFRGLQASQGHVLWGHHSDLYLYHAGSTTQLTTDGVWKSDIDILGNRIGWCQSDGHDDEVYYYDGSVVKRLTSNNQFDDYVLLLQNGLVWYGRDESETASGLQYYDGVSRQMLSSDAVGYDKARYNNGVMFSSWSYIRKVEFQ